MPRQLTIQIASLIRAPLQSGSSRLHPLAQNLLARLLTFAPLHSPEFFGLVGNDVEIAVYASADMIRRAVDDLCATQQQQDKWIEVTDDMWKVFQVDGEGMGGLKGEDDADQLLAEAGISCKYQSSYYADFVLVKSQRFAETMELFQNCGCKALSSSSITWLIRTPFGTGAVEDPSDHTPTSPSSAHGSSRSRSPQTPRGHPSRQSTSSLPEVSNEWITYYDSPAAAVTVPRRRPRPHTADECIGNNQQARRRGGLRSLANGGVKRRSMSNVLDLQRGERLERDREEEAWFANEENANLQSFRVELEDERDPEVILPQQGNDKRYGEGGSLEGSDVASSWSEALAEQLDGLLLEQRSEPSLKNAEESRSSTPPSMTINLSRSKKPTRDLMYDISPSCPVRSSGQDLHVESASSSAPMVTQLQGTIAVVGLNKETESQWEHRVQVFLVYPEEQVRVVRNRHSDGRPRRKEPGKRSQEEAMSENQIKEHTTVSKGRISQARSEYGSFGITNAPFIAYIRTREGTSLATEISIIRSLFPNEGERDSLLQSGGELDMFDDDESQKGRPAPVRVDDQIPHSVIRDSRIESAGVATVSFPGRIKLDMSDSGYGSELGTAGMDVHQVPIKDSRRSSSPERGDGWKSERGVKYCLQLYCQQPGVCKEGGEQEEESVHTDLIADISKRFSKENGLNMLYASTYHSANILVESQHVRAATRILDDVVGGFGKDSKV
ncbi:hypothetical protein QFC21_003099 [Naganishia friedmannii]|uniref:Uncharacterized protein n=1 Tax=Naganishia friedmannii TaxID=89922 RepID=A0ACC2VS98_9TREE|nr:hypothetical protein QFC21_003099 [Naganishia friedmannii]